ncbi:TetR/AcrR family transcriptional regulator [Hathewaya limosa]|nr:TetR/AcrR family transcriptional regulator [Hathewaya limosa]
MKGDCMEMTGKRKIVSQKKKRKEHDLFQAAYELFITKGFNDTSIDDIVKKAGVAKGTFYLYFKDKFDIINKIILRKSITVLHEALQTTETEYRGNFVDGIIYFTDYIIEYFKANKFILKLINKNFSWGIVKRAFSDSKQDEQITSLVDKFTDNIATKGKTKEEAEKTLFIIIELIGAVCYSSIVLREPDDIDSMKPVLFDAIRKILEN